MHNLPIEGYSQAIDALTVTATGISGKVAIGMVLVKLGPSIEAEMKKPFTFQGAKGWAAGSVRYAEKFDSRAQKLWSIIMVTGEQSKEAFKIAVRQEGLKFTRCDIACDIFLWDKVEGLARVLKDNYNGRQKVTLIESDTGDTVYIGSRESEAYLRIYDKSASYALPKGRVWRWEVEYKRGLAHPAVREVEEGSEDIIRQMVFREARTKDVPVPIIEGSRGIKRTSVCASSAEMKLAWLERQVLPTVSWLQRLGLKEEVMGALQLSIPELDKLTNLR
jgi:hypothetical protein